MHHHSPTGNPSFSVIVPLYNEAENLAPLIETILKELGADPSFLELVLIDDGSRDQTAELAREYAAREPRVRLVQHERNRGLGAAIRTGLQAARGDLILYTDADLPFDFSLIPQLIARAGDEQIVIGCRLNRGEGARRWVLTKGYNLLIQALFGLRVRDVNFACKILPRRVAHAMRLRAEGSFIDAEMLLEARGAGLSISEYPLVYYPRARGQSTLSRPGVIVGILRELAKYIFRPASAEDTVLARLGRAPLVKYSLAFIVTITALLLAWLTQAQPVGTSLLFLAGITLASLVGGWKPGVLATALSVLAIDIFLRPPVWSLTIDGDDPPRLALFTAVALLAAAINAARRTLISGG